MLEGQSELNQAALDSLQRSLQHIGIAQAANNATDRDSGLVGAIEEMEFGIAKLGTNINFNIGAGMLMF